MKLLAFRQGGTGEMQPVDSDDFFKKILDLMLQRAALSMCYIDDSDPFLVRIRNTLCHTWAFASDDDLLLFAARMNAEYRMNYTVESVRACRREHQLHLALNQSH
ncbi:MAG: hypothetical protein KGI50_03825 [Patescibacteria group bacterium]|nr:hypothetical protein [Patescibacteria group bacterium]MDE2438417.1 hypothetical protein [Patescibacteria group bacterium]